MLDTSTPNDQMKGVYQVIHPHTKLQYVNENIDFGVFATEFIPKGTIT